MRTPWTVRVAAWSARHRWPVFVLWFAATLGTLGAGFAAGGINALDVNESLLRQAWRSVAPRALLKAVGE